MIRILITGGAGFIGSAFVRLALAELPGCEVTNLDSLTYPGNPDNLDVLEKPHSLIRFVKDRPGHDRRYAIDSSLVESELSWRPRETWESGLHKTIEWYKANPDWLDRVRSGAYRKYYAQQYGAEVGAA